MIKLFYLTHIWDPNKFNTLGQSGPENNGNKSVLHNPQTFKTRASSDFIFKKGPS